MRIVVISIFILLCGCTGYSIVSLTSNIVTYSATGKTNSDHVISYVTAKDCKLFRVIDKTEKVCQENLRRAIIARNEKEININENNFTEEKEIVLAQKETNINENNFTKEKEIVLPQKETNINENNFTEEKEIVLAQLNSEKILKNKQEQINNEITNKKNEPIYKKVAMNIYYGSITWAEYQITKGTEVTDRIGLTENLTLEVKKTFRNYLY